jgi:malate dehydrogenase (oxaloacetate-decarboxylating)(NADP+)
MSFQIQVIKPTVLIGSSGVGKTFTKEVVEAMTANNKVKSYLTLVMCIYMKKFE